ncbi:hypothetical protein L2E82_41093 [Cichorium intybus]|uniref:Uncharacterized protein n=1 Tax=Cichorium intybus TaxID=13427 RepID=A0ACB9ALS7_CICIN|nr:hypothetical protein L2E82_41093 [Cichorium intybus]
MRNQWKNRVQEGRSFVDVTVNSDDEVDAEESEDDSEGISETWVDDRMEEEREEGEFVPDDPANGDDLMDMPGNIGNGENAASEVAIGINDGSGKDDEKEVVEVGESEQHANCPMTNKSEGRSKVGSGEPNENDQTSNWARNGEKKMGYAEEFNGLSTLITNGCFGPFPLRKENNNEQENTDNSSPSRSKSETSKSTEGRVKRRRVRSENTRNPPNEKDCRNSDRLADGSIDLNAKPYGVPCARSSDNLASPEVSLESTTQEVMATIEVGKEIGIHLNSEDEGVVQLLANGGGRNKV